MEMVEAKAALVVEKTMDPREVSKTTDWTPSSPPSTTKSKEKKTMEEGATQTNFLQT